MELYSIREGEELVKGARSAIELYISSPHFNKTVLIESHLKKFTEEHGVFVTVEHYPTKTLRGCIGFPKPIGPVKRALVDAAIAAAVEDPRFVPVSHMEFDDITIEVNILSKLEHIKGSTPESRKRQVKVGRDGLVIEYGYHSGLLLPIVPVEQGWDKEKFLDNTCMKAGLPNHIWKLHEANLYKFTTQVFRELSPRGPIEEIVFR